MQLSKLIARIASVIYLSAAAGAALDANYYRRVMDEMFGNAGVTYLGGFIAVVIGFLIVTYHDARAKNWTILIAIISWLSLLKGVVIIVLPEFMHSFAAAMFAGPGVRIFPFAALCAGLVFGYFGFVWTAAPPRAPASS